MANLFYNATGNPGPHTDGFSALIRGEFLLIQTAFDHMPQISTIGVFNTIFAQSGNFTFVLPSAPGTLAMLSDIALETAARAAAITTEATARVAGDATEVTARTAAIAIETTRAVAAEVGITTNATAITTEAAARIAADAGEIIARNAAIAMETMDRTAAVTTEMTRALGAEASLASLVSLRGYIGGLGLSNNASTPNTVVDVAPGSAGDSAALTVVTLPSTISKSIFGAWVAGSGQSGMGPGLTATASTWYHVFLATIAGVTDVFFDTTIPPTHPPAGTTASRRIGSIYAGVGIVIAPFVQTGDNFQWVGTPVDLSGVTLTTAGRTLYTLFTPAGVRTTALFRGQGNCTSNSLAVDFTSPDCSDQAVATAADMTANINNLSAGRYSVRTNLSSQVGIRALNASSSMSLMTIGWTDSRGRD